MQIANLRSWQKLTPSQETQIRPELLAVLDGLAVHVAQYERCEYELERLERSEDAHRLMEKRDRALLRYRRMLPKLTAACRNARWPKS